MSKKILKVTLQDDGLKGMIVRFEQPSKRLEMDFRDKHNVHYRAPVNKEIIEVMESFKCHLIALNRLDANIAYEEIRITDVEAHDGWFKIGGKVRSVDAGEYISRSKKIDDNGTYDGAQDATEKISALYREVRAYIKEKKVMDPAQMVINFSKTDKHFDEKFPGGVESMSEQEQRDYYRKGCEKLNMIVIEQEPEPVVIEEEPGEGAEGIPSDDISDDSDEAVVNIDQHEAAVAPVREEEGKIRQLTPEVPPKDHAEDKGVVKKKKFGT